MTKMVVDADELNAIARTIDSCATEVAALGAGLASCAHCAMPAALQPQIDELVRIADRVLDEVAVRLYEEGIALAERAILAARAAGGAMPAVALASPTTSVSVIGGDAGPHFRVHGPDGSLLSGLAFGPATIGGDPSLGFTVLGADGTPAGPAAGGLVSTATLGGSSIGLGGLGGLGGGTTTLGGASDPARITVRAGGRDVTVRMDLGHRSDLEAKVRELTGMPTPPPRPLRPTAGSAEDISGYGIVMTDPHFWHNPFRDGGRSSAFGVMTDALDPPPTASDS